MSKSKEVDPNGNEIWVNDFTEKSAQEFRHRVLEIAELDPNQVIPIYIDSYGGYVDSLAKMIATMNEVPNRFITICMGKAMSCGAIMLSHGDLRFIDPLSRVMVHNVSMASWGDVYALKAGSDESMRMNKKFMGLLAANCGKTYEQLQKHIKAATDSKELWMDADDAKKFGIIDEIGIPDIVPVVQWSYNIRPPKERLTDKPKAAKKKTKK